MGPSSPSDPACSAPTASISGTSQAASPDTRTLAPARIAAEADFTSQGFSRRQPAGGSSKATPRTASLAVVTAALQPKASAIVIAIELAPRCPPKSGTTALPSSETQMTGGSVSLLRRTCASDLIKIPAAQIPMIVLPAWKCSRNWAPTSDFPASGLSRLNPRKTIGASSAKPTLRAVSRLDSPKAKTTVSVRVTSVWPANQDC